MQTLFVALPYVRTKKPFYVAGVSLRSSQDTERLSAEEAAHLKSIASSFCLTDDEPITEVSYAVLHLSDNPTERDKQVSQLRAAHTILTYLVTRDDFDSYEQCSIYLFFPTQVAELGKQAMTPGYRVVANWLYEFEISTGRSIYPALPYPELFIPQGWSLSDIPDQLEVSRSLFYGLEAFVKGELLDQPEQSKRFETVLQAMAWYNRSFSKFVSDEEELVHLAIAFEILFHQPETSSLKIRDELKSRLWGLFGEAKRLDDWINQFYSVRSSILHEGGAAILNFVAGDKRPSEQQLVMGSLVSYGRRLLRLCILNILHGSVLAEEANLNAWFVHDRERLEEACKRLSNEAIPPEQRLFSVISHMSDLKDHWLDQRYQRDIELKTIHATGRLLIKAYLEAYPETEDALKQKLMTAMNTGLESPVEMITQYSDLADDLIRGIAVYKDQYWPRRPAHALAYFAKYAESSSLILKAYDLAKRNKPKS